MASNPSFQDLQWLIQAIKSDTVNLQNISFYLSQQPTSKCFQETENSFTVHISKDDQLCFSNLLQVLIASKHTRSLLRNLECHQVVWEPNQLRDLRMLLESRSSVKQLLFQRNVFDKECLLELSDVLKRSGVVKEIMICESGIGSSGAVLLANALKENDNLEELQIWDDSIGSNGADEFSKMIEVNSTLKQLTIFDSNSSIATPLISGNGTLRIYKLDFSGSCTVTCTLGWNTTVKSVDLSGVHLKSQWAKEFRWILEQNQNLIEVNLSNTCLKDKGVVYVSAGLFKNKSLQSLSMDGNWFNGIGVEHLLTPLSRFSSPTVFTVDARSSVSVTKLTHHLKKTSNAILQRVPRVYELCNDLIQILADWRSENHKKPAMKWNEFNELCQVKVPSLRIRSRHNNKEKVEMRRRVTAKCLHHIGEVIYFEELGFIILDFEWFCGEVLSQLISLDVKKQIATENNGFVSRKELEKILRKSLHSQIPGKGSKVFGDLEASDLVKMMLKLELCYEQNPSDSNSMLLIPSVLEEGRGRTQKWQETKPDCLYVGRHLECDDSSHMFLTPGFFPRLQVHLHNKIIGKNNQHGATYSIEKYLILVNINGIYIRVELGGQFGYYIDILACSTKNLTETLRHLQQLIIPAIHGLCNGVTLNENILRQECVKILMPPRYRRTQFLSLQKLKNALLLVPAESMYDYQHTWSSVTDSGRQILGLGFDYARDLLSDDDFREVLHRRYHDLHNLAQELQDPSVNHQNNASSTGEGQEQEHDSKIEPTFGGIAKGLEQVLQRLKIIEKEIRNVKQEIEGLRYYEHRLLIELHQKMNFLVTYTVQIEERTVPNMFYFVETENYSRKLVTNMIPGMTALRLHMLCEYRNEMHVVEDQLGCEIMQIDNKSIKCLAPYMKKFMKLLTFALKIGAHLAAGMGEMIPDLSKEISHLASSSMVHGATGAAAAGALGAMAVGSRTREVDTLQDQRIAQQWVLDFLREHQCSTGKEIAEKFGLWRVRYRDSGQIAWICRRHIIHRAHDIFEVPI